jgi:hypothetical protein
MAIHLLAQELLAVKDFWSLEKSGGDKGICTLGGIVIISNHVIDTEFRRRRMEKHR